MDQSTARAVKAAKIAKVLAMHGASVDTAKQLPPYGRRMVEELAEVPEASDATWSAVFVLLDMVSALPADPFPKGAA